MTKRIFCAICLVAVSVFAASVALFMGVLYDYFSGVQQSQLRMQTNLAAQGVAGLGMAYFDDLEAANYRISWIDADGTVLYDSESAAAEMENHLERQEIKQALTAGLGESSRYSTTLLERSLYCAQLLPDGTVVRLAVAQSTLLTLLLGMLQPICLIFIVALGLALLLAARLAKKIVRPLNELNLDEPLNNDGYEELAPLLRRLAGQQRQIRAQQEELQRRQVEFETVTANMKEGLVLLNRTGRILSINQAAAQLLGADRSAVGRDILAVNRSPGLTALLNKAAAGEYAETVLELGGGEYQLDASPVMAGGAVSGTVLLLLDVGEKMKAEQLRREFTANVSHELKTPLHTISGCAELLVNGMVRPEDTGRFVRQIYAESRRMIELVEDIIKLAHLDEGAEDMRRENVDLYFLAQSALELLRPAAEAAGVKLKLQGQPAVIWGVSQLLSEIIFNLCDNAIKYNRANGQVTVNVANEDKAALLTVSDTGIGIPPECRQRIFERFYRVDKSRSKEVGGTGLGLSIVKHAAKLHNAEISVAGVLGEGTAITVRFPKNQTNL